MSTKNKDKTQEQTEVAPTEVQDQPDEQVQSERKPRQQRTKRYTFPDIDGGGPSVTIDATSIEEATALFRKGHA